MKNRPNIKYAIRPQADGSWVVIEKDMNTGVINIESHHNTRDEAHDALEDLYMIPTQAETLEYFHNLQDSIRKA